MRTFEATIRDVARARLNCLPQRLKTVLEAITTSGRRYIEWARREILDNLMGLVKSQVTSVTELANALQEASIQDGPSSRRLELKAALEREIRLSAGQLAQSLGEQMKAHGYTPESVLFELLQNADDAVIQRRNGLGLPAGDEVLIDLSDSDALTFIHWGLQLARPTERLEEGPAGVGR